MTPSQQLVRVKRLERIYSLLVHLYPAPFREKFGDSMTQVFRGQCLDAIEQGRWRVIVFCVRTILDFAWTCPKEHLVALPTLPSRMWEDLLRKPVWFHPTLIAVFAFGVSVFVTLNLPQFYASTVTLEVADPPYDTGPYFIQTEFEKLQSKAVLYPVITNLALGVHYGELSTTVDEPPYEVSMEEAYQNLKSNLQISQIKNTKLVEVTILDEDKSLATKIANEIGTTYRHWRNEESYETTRGSVQLADGPMPQNPIPSIDQADIKNRSAAIAGNVPLVKVINPAEDAIRPSRPNRYLNIFAGGVASLLGGAVMMLGLWVIKRRHGLRAELVASQNL
ncbi:hypothetical protein GC207_03370 [bacterium]|nr:hypothetical protein [bacterium]